MVLFTAFITLCLFVVDVTVATKGIDVATPVSSSGFKCLRNEGYDFLIVRAYRSIGKPDGNVVQTIANARQAGFKQIDVYMFPCPKCNKSATVQVQEMVGALKGVSYGQIWLDIEQSLYWTGNYTGNQIIFEELLKEASKNKQTGIYSNKYYWNEIMGNSYSGGSSHPLWYAHYDNNPSFSDFTTFGGWSTPAMKQYAGDKTVCGVGVDLNVN